MSPGAATIQILYQPDHDPTGAAAYGVIGEVATDAAGNFSADLSLPGSGRVRAAFAGDGTRPTVEGTPITVVVRPLIDLSLTPRQVRSGERTTVFGTVEPGGATWGKLVVHRRVGRRAYRVESRRVAITNNTVNTFFRPPEPGLYRVTLKINGARVRRHVRAV